MVWNLFVCRHDHVLMENSSKYAVVSASPNELGMMCYGWCDSCLDYSHMVLAYNCMLPEAKRILEAHNIGAHAEVVAMGKLLWREPAPGETVPMKWGR